MQQFLPQGQVVGLQAGAAGTWQRSETWAFAAVMSIDLAVSLVVWNATRSGGAEEV